jgi:hypothetical protein
MGIFDTSYLVTLGILGVIEAIVLFIFYKIGAKIKILVPIFLLLFLLTAVIIIPAVHYPVSKNPRIPRNVKVK